MTKLSLLILPWLVSCATVLSKLDETDEIPREESQSLSSEHTSCQQPAARSPQLVGSNPAAQQSFNDFLRSNAALELDFREKVVLWSLLQVNIRPDLASPTARFQFMSREKGQTQYLDFVTPESEAHAYPFFEGLSHLLKGHPRHRPLAWYARLLDEKFSHEVVAEKMLEQRLRQMSLTIAGNEELRRHFFRGDEVLRESERLSRVRFERLVNEWGKNRRPSPFNDSLFTYRRTPKLDVRCNYDFTLYDNSIFLIDKDENLGHLFGLTQGDDAFLAVAAQKTTQAQALFSEPVFAGSARVRSSAFCRLKVEEKEVWVVSNQSRDPGQHVYHLFRYGLSQASKPQDITRLLRHARHMFLSDPLRLVIESARGREEQVQELLKLNVPIYNAHSIGNIWAWARFAPGDGRFFIDDRNPGALFCSP